MSGVYKNVLGFRLLIWEFNSKYVCGRYEKSVIVGEVIKIGEDNFLVIDFLGL